MITSKYTGAVTFLLIRVLFLVQVTIDDAYVFLRMRLR